MAAAASAAASNQRNVFLNPERAPALIAKWQKLLGTELEEIRVIYKADGVSVELFGLGDFAKKDKEGDDESFSVADFRAKKKEVQAPSGEDAKFAFMNKFEVRLNQEFPQTINLGDGSESAIRSAVQALPFNQRRVMLMSNKQFKAAYPNGLAAGQQPAA